jgi:hypothetical protein
MDRYQILKNPDLPPCHAYALTPEEQAIEEKERQFKEIQTLRSPSDIRESIISQHLQTRNGRARLAASMMNSLRQRMDMESLARRIFSVQPLPAGTLPIYPRVRGQPAYVIHEDGQRVQSVIRRERIVIPLLEIGSNPQIPLSDIRFRRYDLIERAQDLAYQDIRRAEESRAFDLLRAASNGNTILVAEHFNSQASVTNALQTAFDSMDDRELRTANIFLSTRDYSTFRQYISRDAFDEETHNRLIWGAQIFVTNVLPPGEIYLTAEPQNVGVLPIRTDITVLSADDPSSIGWAVFETIGMGCLNPAGVSRLTVPQTETQTIT